MRIPSGPERTDGVCIRAANCKCPLLVSPPPELLDGFLGAPQERCSSRASLSTRIIIHHYPPKGAAARALEASCLGMLKCRGLCVQWRPRQRSGRAGQVHVGPRLYLAQQVRRPAFLPLGFQKKRIFRQSEATLKMTPFESCSQVQARYFYTLKAPDLEESRAGRTRRWYCTRVVCSKVVPCLPWIVCWRETHVIPCSVVPRSLSACS